MENASPQYFLLFIILCLVFQGYFTMMEMAFLSFNRLRLQYYISQGDRKALWLGSLLNKPTYLFGTTLIGVNLFLQLGSECARLFYASLGLNPDYAILSQVVIVMIFAELSPMFAARMHAEHVMRLGITPIYFLSKALTPIILILNGICRIIDFLLRTPPHAGHYLTREELQRALETKESGKNAKEQKDLDSLVDNIFSLRGKTPKDLMIPLSKVHMVSYDAEAHVAKKMASAHFIPYLPLFYKNHANITGVLYTRSLLRLADTDLVREVALSPWFITEKNSPFQVLKQFRWNNQQFAVVLDDNGMATGILTLDCLIDEIFESIKASPIHTTHKPLIVVDRAFPAATSVHEINKTLGIQLPYEEDDTLEDLMSNYLGHSPLKSESVEAGEFKLTLEETPFLADKTVRITSL